MPSVVWKYVYDCKCVLEMILNMVFFFKLIYQLNMNMYLIDYALNLFFMGYTLTFINMFI